MGFLKAALTASLLLASNVAALDRVSVKGTKFYKANGDQFYIKGVAYQQDTSAAGGESKDGTYKDPLADSSACTRDVPLLKDLGINAIRTYAIDPTADHSACMKLLIDAGIYVISDLSEPSLSINRDDPGWDTKLYARYTAVIDEMAKYENVIGFFAGNEVSNNVTNTGASAFVKAAVRDSKKYIKSKYSSLKLSVGYACNDDDKIRTPMAQYFNCGPADESIDFWGYNIYSWCSPSSFTQSGYDVQVKFFSNYSVPVFFAEYGCNTQGGAEGRTWDEVDALYGDQMTNVFSGGVMYMYFEEANDYGIVKVSGNSASTMKNYDALKTKLAGVSPSSTSSGAYTPTNSPATCPGIQTNWKAHESLPPTPDSTLCDCMYNSLSCVPADNLAAKDYGEIFGYICGAKPEACKGIKADTENGVYGPYVMCEAKQKLGQVLDTYYKGQNNDKTACDFGGKAKVNASPQSTGQCSSLIASASSAADVAATQTSASSSGRATSSNPAAVMKMDRMLTMGDFAVGVYVVVAMAVGAGMVLL